MPDALGLPVLVIPLGALPLVLDEAWEKFAVFWADSAKTAREDLTGKTVTADIRWQGAADLAVTVTVTDDEAGLATLSLTALQTADLPLGQLSTLYIAVNGETWASLPVNVLRGIV
jgi:hypothetical protein